HQSSRCLIQCSRRTATPVKRAASTRMEISAYIHYQSSHELNFVTSYCRAAATETERPPIIDRLPTAVLP
ncbi:hypothetical protein, partial [Sinorhizobium meliloti]|uniref:hypothetical protein n=1 Tax=Rhizobium meliloti TaxID=382 RepID=UPI001AECBD76